MPIVNYFEVAADFELAPAEALAFFQAKGLKATFDWRDQLGDEHDLAFTVAKMMDLDLLHTVKGRLDSALENGDSLQTFKRELIPELQKAGWWGKADVIDPKTGQVVKAQLGSASRLETIFRTNLQSAYSVGRWQAIEEQAEDAPYLMYDAVDDHRTRPEHAALDGLVLKVDDPYWNSHAPSNGWNCRCGLIQLDEDQLADHGLREGTAPRVKTRKWTNPRTGDVYRVPTDLDPGWDHNPGKKRFEQLKALAAEKALARYEAKEAAKLAEAQAKIDASVAGYQAKLAKLQADLPALKGKLAAQAQKYAQAELDYHLENKTPYLAQAIKTLQKSKSGQGMTPGELLSAAQEKALVIEQSAHLSAFKAKSISGKPISAKQQAVFDGLPEAAQQSILADIDAKTGTAQAKLDLQKIADYDADQYASTKAELLPADWQNHPDPKALLVQIEAEGNLEGSASAWLLEHEMAGTPYIAQAIKSIKATQAGKAMKASELAEVVKIKAAKLEQSAHLSSYKAKSIAGKEPSDKAKAAFAALPEEAQASISDDIQAKLAKQAEAAAKQAENKAALEELDLITQGQAPELPGIQKSILAKIEADPEQAAQYPEPVDLLQAVQAQAVAQQAKVTQGTLKSGYKKKALAGHIPTPKQKAMFEALTEDEQAELLGEIDAAKAAQAKAAEKAKIQAAMDAASDAAKKDPDDISNIFGHLIDEVIADEGAQLKLQANVDQLLDGHKHQASLASLVKKLTGEQAGDPTPKQAAKYAALDPEDQAKIDALVISKGNIEPLHTFKQGLPKKPAPTPSTPEPTAPVGTPATPGPEGGDPLPALDDLVKIGGQGGSNPGGVYQDTNTGTKWYIKKPATADHAKNEVLTGKLYAAAGVDVAEMHYRNDPEGTRIYSKIIDGLEIDAAGLQAGTVKNVQDNFMVDAWLANWDVVGLGYDNLKVLNGKAMHIDTGAGLLYRAQGTAKGAHFGDTVGEIGSLRDANLNPQAAATFKHLTHADEVAGARKVLSVDQQTIAALVEQYGPGDATAKAVMVKRLLARQADIAQRYPEAVKKPKPLPPPASAVISEQLHQDIVDARVNGVAEIWDKGDIEDHNVRFTYLTDAQGKPITRVTLQLTETAAKRVHTKIKPEIVSAATDSKLIVLADIGDTGARIKELIIGVNAQAGKGLELRDKDIERLTVVRDQLDDLLPKLKAAAIDTEATEAMKAKANAAHQYLGTWQQHIEQATAGLKLGDKAKTIGSEFFEPSNLPAQITKPKTQAAKKVASWEKTSTVRYTTGNTQASHLTLGEGDERLPGTSTIVRRNEADHSIGFFPPGANNRTMTGRVFIDLPGHGDTAGVKAKALLDDLGINTSRVTARDREELYLDQMAWMHTARNKRRHLREPFQALSGTQAARIAAKQAMLSEWHGHDITANHYYAPSARESRQAFSHGRVVNYRSDWKPKDVEALAKTHRLYHNPAGISASGAHGHSTWASLKPVFEGGGMLTSLQDRLRRALKQGNTSPDSDFNSGGGNYVFTRVQENSGTPHAGVFFKAAKHLRRTDATSYDGDKFGDMSDQMQRDHRAGTLAEVEQAAKASGNEFIFKDGLSLFEDLDVIVLYDKAERDQALADLKKMGYTQWPDPDGRPLTEVIKYRGQK